ncbi:uncharacterized protein LOC119301460 isoform X2 [Triticum dicoccoides]|uniref:uncharacterized protein LOC119301460 isoform X2 n=1 Tax=Triticum dicoccoides TaxID=85692 RepID=UPI00188F129E|nr:uncharacterized protein LOC119301460 isoform X2 [Triticum dicoccoides]
MSRPHDAASIVQPNAASIAQPSGNAASQPRLNPIPITFAGPYQTLGAPPPVPYPAPFYHTRRPPAFPPVMPPAAFRGPSIYLPPAWPPGVLGPYPGTAFPPFVDPRYFTQYPIRPGPPGSPQSLMYPPGVISHQRPAVIHGVSDPVAAARPPVPPVAPADILQFNVYIGKIASTVDKDFILSLLQVCGPVKSWKPVTNPIDGTPTAFGFCEFESAESSLRARRLLNKLSVDGQELVLNVNQSTRDYLQKHGGRTIEEKASEADKDAIQKIRSMIIERLKSKLPGSPIPPIQVSANVSIVDENEDGDTRSSALEEREITRQCEKEKHLGKSKAVGLQGRKEREVTAARKSSLQIDALNVNADTYLQKYGQSTTEKKANEADKDAMQKIHSTVEERMKSKCPGSPIPPVQVSASPLSPSGHLGALAGDPGCFPLDDEVVDENSDVDSISIALEERKIRRQCEKEDHLQCWKDREVTAAGKSSLQTDGASTMYAPMECEPTVEHGTKSQHRENGFHRSNGKERRIVFAPGLLSYEQISNAGKKAGYELQATSKPGKNKTLDAKQLLDTVPKEKEELKQLLATVPKTKEELFSHDINWAIYEEHGLHERMRPWISRKFTEIFDAELPEFVDYVVKTMKEHVSAPRMVELFLSLLDDDTERFVVLMWRKLIFEIKRVETELEGTRPCQCAAAQGGV